MSALLHRNCPWGGSYFVAGIEYVSEEHPAVDVYVCDGCGVRTLQPDAIWPPEVEAMMPKGDE